MIARTAVALAVLGALAACSSERSVAPSAPSVVPPSASETPTAPALDPDDAKYLQAAGAAGLPTADYAIRGAHAVCTALRAGTPAAQVAQTVQVQLHWASAAAASYVVAATYAYCPDAAH